MPKLDDKLKDVAEKVLKRKLSDEEELELYRISDAMGMSNIQSFLYLLLVFKLHEDNPKDFKDFISIFETNGIIDRTDQAKLLSESFMMDYSPHEISDFISRIKHGKDIPERV